jgi:hypothetical protein
MNYNELVKEALEKYSVNGLGGWMSVIDRDWISQFLTTKFDRNVTIEIAEVGVFQGGSSLIYLVALPNCKFHAIDNWLGGPASPGFETIKEGFIYFTKQFEDRIVMHSGDSTEIGKQWNIELDLCMVDANHDLHFPREDIFYYSKWIKKNGYLLIDDYDMPNVKQAVDFMILNHPNWKFIHNTVPDGGKVITFQRM